MRCLGRQIEQCADGAAGLFACTQFQNLAKQHKHRDDCGGLEINWNRAAHISKAFGKKAWGQRGKNAVNISRAGTERDQAEHVEASVDDRCPAALKERKTGPQDNGCRKRKLNPGGESGPDKMFESERRNMAAHFQNKDRNRQRQSDPKTPRYIRKLGIGPVARGDH